MEVTLTILDSYDFTRTKHTLSLSPIPLTIPVTHKGTVVTAGATLTSALCWS